MSAEWMKSVIEELEKLRESQDMGVGSLFSEYIQDGADLIVSALLPFKSERTNIIPPPVAQLIPEFSIPSWLMAVINVGNFLNFFRNDGMLTANLMREVLTILKLSSQWEQIFIIEQIPLDVPKKEVREVILRTVAESKGRIVNPITDVILLPPGEGDVYYVHTTSKISLNNI